jgi:type IV secretory pathway ATPase VirB11/archaellum biosynthesis ATPase
VADEASHTKLDDAPVDATQSARDQALRAVQVALLKELDTSINKLERARLGESTREHLEILRSLLKAQVNAYLEHFVARNATLFSTTSVMYAGEIGSPGVLSTTLRGLLEGGTLTSGQATKLGHFVNDRRTLLIFGDRATGKSTLLNALFELVSVDERFVAIERGPDLPALKERSFCVRLGVDDDTDIEALFAKARRMQPGRLVIGEIHRGEARHLFALLADMPTVGAMATLRAETVHKAVDAIVTSVGDGDSTAGRAILAATRPVFAHMHSDEKGRPRLAALWSVDGLEGDELQLEEVRTSAPAASRLVAEA